MVAIGLLIQLVLESPMDEAKRVAEFCASVGLPAHYGHLALRTSNRDDMLMEAAVAADALGREVVSRVGDEAYRRLHVVG
jgi:glycerol dehydrogenase-like iron-containing ADH family enzyme